MQSFSDNKIIHFIICAVSLIFSILLIYFINRTNTLWTVLFVDSSAGRAIYFLPMLWFYVFIVILVFIIFKIINKNKFINVLCAIFIITAIPRGFLLTFNIFTPINDFLLYFNFGHLMLNGDFDQIARAIASMQIPRLGGLAVHNGLIARIFSPTLVGFQIANIIITSFISCLIYLISIKFSTQKIAISAAMLFALYPANIVSTQITTNMHLAILYQLLSIYILILAFESKNNMKIYTLVALSGSIISISYFMHGSGLIFFIAQIVFISLLIFNNIQDFINSIKKYKQTKLRMIWKNDFIKYSLALILFILMFNLSSSLGLNILQNRGIIKSLEQQSMLRLIVMGLDAEQPGVVVNNPSVDRVMALPIEDQHNEFITIIRERLNYPFELLEIFHLKTEQTWFWRDTHFVWFTDYIRHYYENLIRDGTISYCQMDRYNQLINMRNSAWTLDVVYTHLIYLFSAFGLIVFIFKKSNNLQSFCLILIIGFFIIIALGEAQARYRYPAMPYFFILASYGIYAIKDLYLQIFHKNKLILNKIKKELCK